MLPSAVLSPWLTQQQQKAAERRVEALPPGAGCSRQRRAVMASVSIAKPSVSTVLLMFQPLLTVFEVFFSLYLLLALLFYVLCVSL